MLLDKFFHYTISGYCNVKFTSCKCFYFTKQAFDLLSTYHEQPERDVTFSIQCGPSNAKGIFLRPRLDDPPKDVGVTIEPHFLQDHNDAESECHFIPYVDYGTIQIRVRGLGDLGPFYCVRFFSSHSILFGLWFSFSFRRPESTFAQGYNNWKFMWRYVQNYVYSM